MKHPLYRYTPDMLQAVGSQSTKSIVLNALIRGVLFTLILQLIALASVGQTSGPLQLLVLAIIFTFIVFSVDIVERAWVQHALRRRS